MICVKSTIAIDFRKLPLERQICHLLEWDHEAYALKKYQNGIAYLHWYLPTDQLGREKLERSKIFWNWFKMQYAKHDEAFASSPGIDDELLSKRRRIYNDLHDPHSLAVDVKPNRIVLAELSKK